MNLQERRELYQHLRQVGYDRITASFDSWRHYTIFKIPFSEKAFNKVFYWLDSRYGEPIRQETEIENLSKRAISARLRLLGSYPLLWGSTGVTLFGGIIHHQSAFYLAAIGALPALYFNWRGETEEAALKSRLNELGLTRKDLFYPTSPAVQ